MQATQMERRETDGKGSYAKNAAINKRGSAAKMAPRARTPGGSARPAWVPSGTPGAQDDAPLRGPALAWMTAK